MQRTCLEGSSARGTGMDGLEIEMAAFLAAILAGMTGACTYLCIRKFRRVVPHSLAAIAVEDGIYWVGTAIYMFVQIYKTSSGSIRWYFVTGVILGVWIFLAIQRIGVRMMNRVYKRHDKKRAKKK